jgi:hypothetical protein
MAGLAVTRVVKLFSSIEDSSERYFLAVGAIFWTFYLVAPVDCWLTP